MNPLIAEWIGSIFRKALAYLAGILTGYGLLSGDLKTKLIEAAVPGLVAIVWELWQRYGGRLKFVTALSQPPTTEKEIEKLIANPNVANPSVLTPKDEIPKPVVSDFRQ